MSRPKKYEISLAEKNLKDMLDNRNFLALLGVISSANKFCRKVNKTRSSIGPLLEDMRTCSSYLDEVNHFILRVVNDDDSNTEVVLRSLRITKRKLLIKREDLFRRIENSSIGIEVITIRFSNEKMKISEIE